MTESTQTLTEFLAARLDEDDGRAQRNFADAERSGWGSYAARVLAEVATKRRILQHEAEWSLTRSAIPEGWTSDTAAAYRIAMAWTLRAIASTYSDHADYQQDWAL